MQYCCYVSKVCRRCEKTRPIESFLKAGRELVSCAPCREYARANNHRNRRANPDKIRADNLWSFYRIRPQEYDARRAAQDYRCAICGRHESELKVRSRGRPRLDGTPNAEPFRLVVDHCHNSRQVRGLLCGACNMGLGAFQESPDALMAAARYLLAREGARTGASS
ncbi:Recombination endonuclease VII [Micromonospora citrea]|uniref:Recombination endonuclease VII n=1 Tax=Micromonospora citrea TaxID=47855 RepID=A0A1C6W2X6_9ACTN|nr:Recombination endonuclease VII [Micromonospora citrea]